MVEYYLRNETFFGRLETVFFYVSDPGAWAVLKVFAEFLEGRGHRCLFLLEGWARQNAAGQVEPCRLASRKDLQRSPRERGALLVYGAQQKFSKNYEMVARCRRAGVETLFVFDSWKNYLINFRDPRDGETYLPSRIAVVDEAMREGVLAALAGCAEDLEERIDILGHPAMESSISYIMNLPQERVAALREQYGEDGKRLILFVMEPIREDFVRVNRMDPGYDEYTILGHFLECFCEERSKVLIKVHPRQDAAEVEGFLSSSGEVRAGVSIQVVCAEKIENLIAIADEVYGMTSIVLNVAIRSGKRVRSLQFGRNRYGETLSNPALEECLVGGTAA